MAHLGFELGLLCYTIFTVLTKSQFFRTTEMVVLQTWFVDQISSIAHTLSKSYLVMTVTSPDPGGAIWCDVPITQSVKYSTNLLRNFISWRKARSSLRFIMASTSWQSFVLIWIARTVRSRWRTYLSTYANL